MEQTHRVLARFDRAADARDALSELELRGIDAAEIHLVARDEAASARPRAVDALVPDRTTGRAILGGLVGALIGAALVIAFVTIVRLDPVGQALLVGGVSGAIGGGFVGGYRGMTAPAVEEAAFDTVVVEERDAGPILVEVRSPDPKVEAAAVSVLRRHHPQQIDREVA